jgi:hypothetical protein
MKALQYTQFTWFCACHGTIVKNMFRVQFLTLRRLAIVVMVVIQRCTTFMKQSCSFSLQPETDFDNATNVYISRRRRSRMTNTCILLGVLLVLGIGIAGGIYLYKHFVRGVSSFFHFHLLPSSLNMSKHELGKYNPLKIFQNSTRSSALSKV